ncbi:recombinase family protein [Methylobacterium brachythecii]|nr:recombinase family protein [Methylobacterium brachythecii]
MKHSEKSKVKAIVRSLKKYFTSGPNPSEEAGAKKFVVYQRKSPGKEFESSIARQLASTTAYARRHGMIPMPGRHIFADVLRSGATLNERDGFALLLAAIRAGGVDVVLAEDVSRFSRIVGDLAWFWRICRHHGTEVHTANDGLIDLTSIALSGYRADEERRRMLERTRHGVWSCAAKGGMLKTSLCFGYRLTGDPERPLEIDPEAAAVVKRIYRQYVRGADPAAIAESLNRDGVRGPKGNEWLPASIAPSGIDHGILDHFLYIGAEVWGRIETRRDENFKRSRVVRDPSKWIVHHHPDLEILRRPLWDQAQRRRTADRAATQAALAAKPRTPRRAPDAPDGPLLSGLVRCGCGRPMSYGGRPGTLEYLHCSAIFSGENDHPGSILSADVERRVLSFLADHPLAEGGTTTGTAPPVEGAAARKRMADEAEKLRAKGACLEERLSAPPGDSSDGLSPDVVRKMQLRLRLQLSELEDDLAAMPEEAPCAAKVRVEGIDRLEARSASFLGPFPFRVRTDADTTLRQHIRGRIHSVAVTPNGRGKGYGLRIELADGIDRGEGTEASPRTHIEFEVPPSHVGYAADPEFVARLTAAAERKVFALDRKVWKAVEPLFVGLSQKGIDGRALAHAAVFLALTRMPRRRAPACFGPAESLSGQLDAMGSTGVWRRLVEQLQALKWPHAAHLDPAAYDAVRRRGGQDKAAEQLRASAVRLEGEQRPASRRPCKRRIQTARRPLPSFRQGKVARSGKDQNGHRRAS